MLTLTDYDNGNPILIRIDLLGVVSLPSDGITRIRTTLGDAFRIKESPATVETRYNNAVARVHGRRSKEA